MVRIIAGRILCNKQKENNETNCLNTHDLLSDSDRINIIPRVQQNTVGNLWGNFHSSSFSPILGINISDDLGDWRKTAELPKKPHCEKS